jgi:hypothetical protein
MAVDVRAEAVVPADDPEERRSLVWMARRKMECILRAIFSSWTRKERRRRGRLRTHWRTGTRGRTLSTRLAEMEAMRREPQEGQRWRVLQEKARTYSCLQDVHLTRAKPWPGMPQCRYSRMERSTWRGMGWRRVRSGW